jgi:hypothetical protein
MMVQVEPDGLDGARADGWSPIPPCFFVCCTLDNYTMHDLENHAWASGIAAEVGQLLNEYAADGIQFVDTPRVATRVYHIVQRIHSPDSELDIRDKVIAAVEYIIDNTDTPWLDDAVFDPLMKAALPAVVDYVMDSCRHVDDSSHDPEPPPLARWFPCMGCTTSS